MSIDRDRERYLDRLTLMGSQMEVRAFVGVSSFAAAAWDDDRVVSTCLAERRETRLVRESTNRRVRLVLSPLSLAVAGNHKRP